MKLSFGRSNWVQALLVLGLIAFVTACGGPEAEEREVEDNVQPQQTETLNEGGEEEAEEAEEGEEGDGDND